MSPSGSGSGSESESVSHPVHHYHHQIRVDLMVLRQTFQERIHHCSLGLAGERIYIHLDTMDRMSYLLLGLPLLCRLVTLLSEWLSESGQW